MSNEKFYTAREEKANYLTHAAGVLMALVATVLLLRKAILADNRWAMLAYAIFGFGMLACMLSSTVYHFVQEPGRKVKWRHFDHASIYLLIAASYSPFTLILLREERFWGWLLFGLVWIIALVGIAVSFGELKKNSHLKTASYVFMGLVVLVAF
ncbi:MAG TPA: hemolysin III family protein, partial [Petrimonas sp.]|nr:hemolysin III family protein [Petrimonas sp.]